MLPQGHAPHPRLGTAKPCASLPSMPAEQWKEGSPCRHGFPASPLALIS